MIGTSQNANKDLYTFDFTKNETVLVFGTESSGLTKQKAEYLDELIKIPMDDRCKFLTLPTAVPIVAYEFYRQIFGGQNASPKR